MAIESQERARRFNEDEAVWQRYEFRRRLRLRLGGESGLTNEVQDALDWIEAERECSPAWCVANRILKGDSNMSTTADRLASEIQALPDVEKLGLVDAILTDLNKPDPEIDRVWAEEARTRWAAYQAGRLTTVSYEEVMAKHLRRQV